jgi:hypothetical protein
MAAASLRLYDGFGHTTPELADQVRAMQMLLAPHAGGLDPDGRFDAATAKALRAFQERRGLPVDGVAGPATWAALRDPATLCWDDRLGTSYRPDDPAMLADLAAATRYRPLLEAVACRHGLLPCVLAGLGSRLSRWGLMLVPAGAAGCADFVPRARLTPERTGPLPPDGLGFGRGLMQLDYDADPAARDGRWRDPGASLALACERLLASRQTLGRRSGLGGHGLLRGTLAAYNCGLGNVMRAIRAGLDLDFYTVGRDFGRDVLDRGGFFQAAGWD